MSYLRVLIVPLIIIVLTLPTSVTIGAETSWSFPKATSQLESIVFSLKSLLNNLRKNFGSVPKSSLVAQVVAPTNGLIGHFKFDEGSGATASDSSGNGNNGTLVNGPVWTSGKFGNALNFDGVDDYVSLPNTTMGTMNTGSVSLWMKTPVTFSGDPSVRLAFGTSGSSPNAKVYIGYDGIGNLHARMVDSPDFTSFQLNPDTWYSVVLRWGTEPGTAEIFVNTISAGSIKNLNFSNSITNENIGSLNKNTSSNYSGSIDEVRIYNRALSSSEISDIYNATGESSPTDSSSTQTQTQTPTTTPTPTFTPAVSAPVISSFTASPSSITSGNSTTLSWSVSGATSVSINQGIGTVTGTSRTVAPTTNTTYTLTATNSSGSVSATALVTVTAVVPVTTSPSSSAAPAPSGNGVTIKDLSGTTQTNRPFTISRVFKQGEIQNFPQARVNDNPVLTQADVKNRWPDGSVKHAMVSFLASLPAGGSVAVDFINQSSGNNNGAMTKAEMLAYDSGNWGAEIQTSIGSANARTVLTDWNGTDTGLNGQGVRYWLKGPIVTQVIVEDKTPSLKYDFGSDSNKSLHPIFVLTFYPGTDLGVKVEYILENMWTTKLQDQSYSLELKTGNPASSVAYSKPLFTHIAQTRWHKTFWSGTKPQGWTDVGHPGITINYNFPYITSTMVLPNFDQSFVVSSSDVGSITRNFLASDRGDIKGKGIWSSKFFGAIDDHTEASLVPKTYTSYLYTFDPGLYAMLLGQADVSAHVPIHLRESATGKFYDVARNVDAFGLPLSINARPTMRSNIGESSIKANDKVNKVGAITNDNWFPEPAHQPNFTYIPYIITGEWYYGDELHFWSAYDFIFPNAKNRHNDWGFLTNMQLRGEARALATVGNDAFIAPDNSYEKAYVTEKLFSNIAIREGKHDIRDGSFYQPCTTSPYNEATETSKWCWGRNSTYVGKGLSNPLHLLGSTAYSVEGHDPTKSGFDGDVLEVAKFNYAAASWMANYHYITYAHLAELGLPIKKLMDTTILNLLGQLASPDYNPNLIEKHTLPVSKPDGTYFDTWAAIKDAYLDTLENMTTINSKSSYNNEVRASASFLPGINSGPMIGQTAWEWISSRTSPINFPNWAWLPRNTFVSSDKNPPSIPTSLSASSISDASVRISWPPSTDNIGVLGYRIYRNGSQIAISGSTSYMDSDLNPSTLYKYTVSSYDGSGNVSAQSSPVLYTTSAFVKSSITTPPGTTPTPTPTTTPTTTTPTPTFTPTPTPTPTPTTTPTPRKKVPKNSDTSSVTTPSESNQTAPSCVPVSLPRNVAFGSKGTDITALQTFLSQNNFLTSDNITGYFGLVTETAVKAFQQKYNIVSSGDPVSTGYGVVGALTRAKIQALTKCTSATHNTNTTPVTQTPKTSPTLPTSYTLLVRGLALGTRGDDVTLLQNLLVDKGYLTADNVTGYYGYATQAAVQAFQRAQNIVSSGTPDTTGYGAVGPATRAKLNALIVPSGTTQIEILQKQVEMLLQMLKQLQGG